MKKTFSIGALLLPWALFAQGSFPPAAGTQGTTAIHKDSSIIINWATGCSINRGPQQISVTNSPLASYGQDANATGYSGANGVVSLGDGGEAVLTFEHPIYNGSGWDFAVFENSFNNTFLELGFVEVSSDGINYFRFDATSETQTISQTDGFGNTDPTMINNLAGKYRAQFGTPFDLEELNNQAGLDIENITHVKIIDVVGSIDPNYGSTDAQGNLINDPYPTAFESGGIDLDAIGVIFQNNPSSIAENSGLIQIYPTKVQDVLNIKNALSTDVVQVLSLDGKLLLSKSNIFGQINVESLPNGIYFIRVGTSVHQFIKI